MFPRLFLFVLAGTITFVCAQTASWTVAVSELVGKGVTQPEADIISDRLRGELVKTEHFAVMEREQMDIILKEQGFQQSGACTEQSCVVSMGQMLGVRYMVSGTVGNVGKIFVLSLKVIDVSTGEIVLTVSEECACAIEEVLLKSTRNVAVKLDNALFRSSHAEVIIETRPPGAMVFLNGTMYGQTPFSSSSFTEGNFHLKLAKTGYVTALDSFDVAKGKTVKRTITLEMTKERADSLHAVAVRDSLCAVAVQDSITKKTRRAKLYKKIFRETAIALVAGAFAGGGFAINQRAAQTIDQKTSLVKQYSASTDQTQMTLLKQQIESKQSDVNTFLLIRNILYGTAGAGVAVFVITIPF
jgi:PEGA domain./Curli production assembly/transport component CsgG.